MNFQYIRNFTADAAVPAKTIVKHGGGDYQATGAIAATDALLGVSTEVPAAAGERMDVVLAGPAEVVAGAAFGRGVPLTSDAQGRAIAAAPAAGANVRVIAISHMAATAAGDIVPVLVAPSVMQG